MAYLIHIIDGKTDRILSVIDESEFWEDKHTKSLKDTLETFDFTTFANKSFSEYLAERNRVIIPGEDGEYIEFIIENTRKFHGADGLFIEVYTSASYIELAKAKVIDPQTTPSWTAKQHAEMALSGTEWAVGTVDFAGSRTIIIESYTNPYSYLKQIASEFNLELHFRVETDGNKVTRRYVDLIEHVGGWNGREVEFGKDLMGIERKEDFSNIVTALVGIGPERDDGTRLQVFVEDKDALARWGRNGKHLVDVYEPDSSDSNMTLEQLRSLTEAELAKRINSSVEYTGDVVDLEKVPGLEHEKFRLGDTIRIKDTAFTPPLYLEARIHTVERSIKQNGQKTVTLGDYIEYTEEDVFAIYKRLQAEIAKKVSLSKVMEVTYTKEEIDTKDSTVYQDSTYYADAVSETKKQEAIQVAADDATQKANQAEQNAKQYAEQYTQQYAEQKAPSETPAVPANFSATGSFKKVVLTWDVDTSKVVAYYELYASQTAGFTPSSTNLIYKGKTSGFTHDVDVNQTWYYRLRAVNAYGQAGAFTNEVSASTVKIISDDILFGAVNAQHIADLAVTAQKLASGAVDNTKLDRTSPNRIVIDSADIKDAAITSAKVATAAIGTAAIQNGAITNAKIANLAVDTAQIADGAITNAKIANLAVDDAKIASLHGSKITASSITADKLNVGTLSAISADLGTVTAGEMTGVVIKTSTSADIEGIVLSGTQLKSNSATYGSNLTIDNGSVKVHNISNYHSEVQADAISFGRSTTSDASIFYYEPADGSFGELTIHSRDYITMDAKEIRTPNTERGFCGVGGVTTGLTGPVAGVGVNFRTKKTYTPSSISLSGISHNLIYSTHLHAIDISPDGFWLYIDGGDTNNAYRYWRGYYTA
ncbi:tail fiber protein [Parageobacillus phage vB_PtoS_NIIg3.2]|nr:tail fiber protein [Parageobacillus phage vB_PtoS_NIIg3.2]